MIHNRLKEQELLTNHIIINNKEYSVNERIVFTERNENIGNEVRTISDHPEKGVKNGTFGTIVAIDEGKLLKKTSFIVKLDDDRVVKFYPESLLQKDFSFCLLK
jgi:ATP-dependent exoDNAse (exonuclease V) alpha subunit